MIFHENRLPADDSHEMSCLICYFFEKAAKLKLLSAANYGGALWVKLGQRVIKSNWKLKRNVKGWLTILNITLIM